MSDTIDRRVVEMRFENKDFENNVQTTLSILDKLKQKLSMKDSGKNFESSGLASAVDTVKNRFSALEVVGMTALVNLTNSAINLGKNLAKSLTVDQVKAGFSEYELKMGSIQTIMASTGKDIGTVNKYLNELNTYSDKTIYSFSDMTSSIGKFTNAGVDLDTAVRAIQGISNEAAVSGANAQEASRAMYNFAQALSAGYVKLIDWKSIENANMATKEFKQQLIDTAVAEGTLEKAADGTYKVLTSGAAGGFKESITATKNFNDSLSAAWMTTDVLTKTLGKYADETTEIGKKAFAAAQDVKTFSQLLDTVKESIGSGWAQTFEIIFGNLEEAKKLWTGVNNVISGFVDRTSDARNSLLQGWKDYTFSMQEADYWQKELKESFIEYGNTARDVLLKSIGNIFKGFSNLVRPIKDAFRSVFSPATSLQLVRMTTSFAEFSVNFRRTMATLGRRLKLPFVDIFKAGKDVIDLFKDALSGLFKVISGDGGESALFSAVVLFTKFIALIARGISAIIAFTRATGIFKVLYSLLSGLNTALYSVFDFLLSMGTSLSDTFSNLVGPVSKVSETLDGLFSKMSGKAGTAITFLSTGIGKLFSLIGKGLSHIDLSKLGGLLAGGGLFAVAMKLSKLLGEVTDKFSKLFGVMGDEGEKAPGLMDNIKNVFSQLGDTLKEFQTSLKVGQLATIAISIGILAASCATLADIPAKKLGKAVAAIAGLFGELAGASHIMGGSGAKGLVAMSIAVLLLAKAVKSLSEIESMGKGLLGVGALFGEIAAFCLIFDRAKIKPKSMSKTAIGLILMAVAINMLAKPVKELGAMDTGQLIQGLEALGGMLVGFAAAAAIFGKVKPKGMVQAGLSMVLMAGAMKLLVPPLTELGALDMSTLGKGLGSMAIALGELVGFTSVMGLISKSGGKIMKSAAALAVMAIGIKIMASAINTMGADANAGKGLSVMFGALIILGGAMALMQKSLAGAAAMIVVAGALMIMAPAIALLSSLNLGGVVVGLVALAGTLITFGALSAILGPVVPIMLALGAAMAFLGVGVLSLGAGMTLLVGAFAMATGPIVEGAKSLAQAIPIIAEGIGNGIVKIIESVAKSAGALKKALTQFINLFLGIILDAVPKIATVGLKLIIALLSGIKQNIAQITNLAIDIVLRFINAVSARLGEIADTGAKLVISFIDGVGDAIANNGPALIASIENLILSIVEVIVGEIPIFGDAASEAVRAYREGLGNSEGIKGVETSAKKVSDTAGKGMEIDPKLSRSQGANATSNTAKGIGDKKANSTLKKNAASVKKKAEDSMKISTKTTRGHGASATSSEAKGISSKKKEVTSSAKAVKKLAEDKSKISVSTMKSHGANATSGLATGLTSGKAWKKLKDAAQKVADLVDKTVKKKNEIKSPSRRLMRTGQFLMLGLTKGVDSMTGQYQKTADNISTILYDSFNNSVKSIDDLTPSIFDNPQFDGLSASINYTLDNKLKEQTRISDAIDDLTKTLDGVVDTMNSRQLVNNIQIDGATDPTAFADALTRRFRLNARTM